MISATITGNLGRDPELKDTKTGKKMATFSLASTTKREGRDPETTWMDAVCFDEVAVGAAGNLRKGMKIIATGQLSLETFERREGGEGTKLRLVVHDIGLMIREKAEEEKSSARRGRDEPW